jgi:Predicted membrane protein
MLFGLGEGLLIVSLSGASPWSVLAQGISLNINYSIGIITLFISFVVLIMWIPLKQKPGMGTILNALIIAAMIDLCINFVPSPESYISQIILALVAVLIVGIGGGIYLVANLGPGPRDGLMIGLQKVTNLPIASVRGFIEISVVSVGWYLGGTVGIGTLLFAFGIGPAVALGLYLVDKIFNN